MSVRTFATGTPRKVSVGVVLVYGEGSAKQGPFVGYQEALMNGSRSSATTRWDTPGVRSGGISRTGRRIIMRHGPAPNDGGTSASSSLKSHPGPSEAVSVRRARLCQGRSRRGRAAGAACAGVRVPDCRLRAP